MNRNKVGIIADSTADILPEIVKQQQITLIPIHIYVNSRDFLHGRDITNRQLIQRLRLKHDISTSPPFPAEYSKAYEEIAARYERVYSMHVSSELSRCYVSAKSALKSVNPRVADRIKIIDTRSTSIAQGQIIHRVATYLKTKGHSGVERYLEKLIQHSRMFFVVNDLYWLKRSGRLNFLSAFVGKMMDLKPVIGMENGFLSPVEKCRGKESSIKNLINVVCKTAAQMGSGVEIWVGHSDAAMNARRIQEKIAAILRIEKNSIPVLELGPTMTAHTGPECLCVSLLPSRI